MATINSIFKMQDSATRTLLSVAKGIDNVIDKADALSSAASDLGPGISSVNPALSQAIGKYQSLIDAQEDLNTQIEFMNREQNILITRLNQEKSAYNKNERAILGIERKLFSVERQKNKLIKQSETLTNEILDQAAAVNQVANNSGNINPNLQEGSGIWDTWQGKITAINQSLQLIKSVAGGVKSAMDYTDNLTLTKARLDLINDGTRTTAELQDDIYAAAERSRGSYDDMAKSVAKLGLLAGDSFSGNDEMIAFSEMMQKSFKVSGASQQEISSATYQLTQAMAAGKLQGDEFRSITENAPMLADAIAKYMGKSKGELKELSSEGVITSDIIKNALFSAADDINEKYEQMPRTFADSMTSIENAAAKSFQPVSDAISQMINSEAFQKVVDGVIWGIQKLADATLWIINAGKKVYSFVQKIMPVIEAIVAGVITYLGIYAMTTLITLLPAIWSTVTALLAKAAAWAAANWQMLLIVGTFALVYAAIDTMNPILGILAGLILAVAIAIGIWKVVQWALNTAMYACPIVWIIVLIIAVIAAIFLLLKWIIKLTNSTDSALGWIIGGVMVAAAAVYNVVAAMVNVLIDTFVILWNFIAALANFFGNVFRDPVGSIARLFFDLVDTILALLESLAGVIDTIFGSKLSKSVKGWRNDLGGWVDDTFGEENEVMAKMDANDLHLGRWEYGDAWDTGRTFGNDISDAIDNFSLDGLIPKDPSEDSGYDYESLLNGNGNVPVDIENNKDKEVDISDEDLKMLKDIATREYMLNYKQVTPNVQISFGDVRETADVNEIKEELRRMMEEELSELYVVEEA